MYVLMKYFTLVAFHCHTPVHTWSQHYHLKGLLSYLKTSFHMEKNNTFFLTFSGLPDVHQQEEVTMLFYL